MDSDTSGDSIKSMSLDTGSSVSLGPSNVSDCSKSIESSNICSDCSKSMESSNDYADSSKIMKSSNACTESSRSMQSSSKRLPTMEDDVNVDNEYNFNFFEKLLAVFSFTVQYNLPYTAVDQMLQLMELWSNSTPNYKELESVYQMRRYLDRNMLRPEIYYLCPSSNCPGSYLEDNIPNICTQDGCNEPLLVENLRKKGQYFLYTPLAQQIKLVLEIKEMEEIMSNYLDGAVHQGMKSHPNSLINLFSSKRYGL